MNSMAKAVSYQSLLIWTFILCIQLCIQWIHFTDIFRIPMDTLGYTFKWSFNKFSLLFIEVKPT